MIRAYAHNGLTIGIEADADEHTWLEEFLTPAFAVADVPMQAVDVRVGLDPIAPPTAGDRDSDTCVAFAQDSSPLELPVRRTSRGLAVHDATDGIVYAVEDDGRSTRVGVYGDRLQARAHVLRVVREYAHNHSIARGAVVLHAAAIVTRGRAVLIAGPKHSGKTTTMLRLLEQTGVGFLSNDRVVVRHGTPPAALAVPTVVAIRSGSRELLPSIAARLAHCGDLLQHREARLAAGPRPPRTWQDAWHISPPQLCAALPCASEACAPVGAVVFPNADRESAFVDRLDDERAATAIDGALLCRASGRFCSEVFTLGATPPEANEMMRRCRALVPAVACYAIGVPDVRANASLATLIAACLERPC
ncbi:MAG: hypothetical protein IT184_15745 [Acidobacteria bacterium]|nr:hypothetical protein [Acidobacteriota bacterium]